MKYCSLYGLYFYHHQTHPQLAVVSSFLSLIIPSGAISTLFSSSILGTYLPGQAKFHTGWNSKINYNFQISYANWYELNWSFPGGSDSKESACIAGDPCSIPELGGCPREWRGAHSSLLAWRIPWTEEPGGLQSMRSQRVSHDWVTITHTHTHTHEIYWLYKPFSNQVILEQKWVLILVIQLCVRLLSRVRLLVTPWTVAHQAPLSMGFPRQEYWSGLSSPSPGDFPNPGIKLMFPVTSTLADEFFTDAPPGKYS